MSVTSFSFRVGSKVLAPVEALELFNSKEWEITGGRGVSKGERLRVIGASLDESGLVLLRPPAEPIRLKFGDVVIRDEPARIIVQGFVPTKCQRAKAEGGGEHIRMLPDTRLRLRNQSLQDELDRQAREAAEAQRRASQESYLHLGLKGSVLESVSDSLDGLIIRFTDGKELLVRRTGTLQVLMS